MRTVAETEYVDIPVDLPLETLGRLALKAHALDITMNQFFNYTLGMAAGLDPADALAVALGERAFPEVTPESRDR